MANSMYPNSQERVSEYEAMGKLLDQVLGPSNQSGAGTPCTPNMPSTLSVQARRTRQRYLRRVVVRMLRSRRALASLSPSTSVNPITRTTESSGKRKETCVCSGVITDLMQQVRERYEMSRRLTSATSVHPTRSNMRCPLCGRLWDARIEVSELITLYDRGFVRG